MLKVIEIGFSVSELTCFCGVLSSKHRLLCKHLLIGTAPFSYNSMVCRDHLAFENHIIFNWQLYCQDNKTCMSISITHLMDHESTSFARTSMPTADSTYHPRSNNLTSNIDATLNDVD